MLTADPGMATVDALPSMSGSPHAFMSGLPVSSGHHETPVLPIVQNDYAPRSTDPSDIIDLSHDSPSEDRNEPPTPPRPAPQSVPSAATPQPQIDRQHTPSSSTGAQQTGVKQLLSLSTIPHYFTLAKPPSSGSSSSPLSGGGSPLAVAPTKRKADDLSPKAGPSKPATAKGAEGIDRLRSYLEPAVLQGTRPKDLFEDLVKDEDSGKAKVQLNAADLNEVVSKLSEHASTTYLHTMADEEDYTEVVSLWLRRFKKNPEMHATSIAPTFTMLARTNMAINFIEEFEVLQLIRDIMSLCLELGEGECIQSCRADNAVRVPLGAIRTAYVKYMNNYKNVLLPQNRRILLDDSDSDSDDDKPIAKKPRTAPKPPGKLDSFKIEKKPAAPLRKADNFGTPARPRPPTDVKPPIAAPAKPTSLLGSTLAKLKQSGQSSIPAYVPREPKPDLASLSFKPKGPKLNKKGHTVRWVDSVPDPAPDRPLEAVKLFTESPWEHERAPWQEVEGDELHGMTAHQLDVGEGSALKHFGDESEALEEQIDWFEPPEYQIDNYVADTPQPPLHTPEVAAQADRERSILSVSYLINDIPLSADESSVRISTDTGSTKYLSRPPRSPVPQSAPVPDISSLLSNLANIPTIHNAQAQQALPIPPPQFSQYQQPPPRTQNRWAAPAAAPRPQEPYYPPQTQQPAYNQYSQYGAPGYTPGNASPYNGYPAPAASYANDYNRGGRSPEYKPERKNRRRCKFITQRGSCMKGDRCNFSHDI